MVSSEVRVRESLLKYGLFSAFKLIFVAASQQTELDTRSLTRRSILVGIRGREDRVRAEA